MLRKLLGKGKRKRGSDDPLAGIEPDESIDLEKGVIYIDDRVDPSKVVATSEVFDDIKREEAKKPAAAPQKLSKIAGGGAKIFLLDLRPFFKAVGTKKGERAAENFTRFAGNWLARLIGSDGKYELVDGDTYFFRLNMPNREAAREAVHIVNEIGVQYLRDAYKTDILPELLGAIDADEVGADGAIDAKRARHVLEGWRALSREARETAFAESWTTKSASDDPAAYLVPIQVGRKASDRVQRGPERRKDAKPFVGQDRRRRKRGRRAADKADGRTAVWT